jgi:N-ethylmaleimide reductase
MADYYAQRTGAGLIISEATQISAQGKGYSFTPGIYTKEQILGWKKVTRKVHAAQGKIFSQLWHVGRMSHAVFHDDGLPVAPSAIAPDAQVWIVGEDGEGRMLDCPTPRELESAEIKSIIDDYQQAAKNAMLAGFDGVEIHGANGYLIDQFLRRSSNHRDDKFGGSIDNRIRFAIDVVETVCTAIGADKVGIRLAPFITQRGMQDDEITDAILAVAKKLNQLGVAYIHLSEADWEEAPVVPDKFRNDLRSVFNGTIIVAGNYTAESGANLIEQGLADAVAFGRKFIANPDLPARFANNWPLDNISDAGTLFGGNEKGYTDYTNYMAANI